MTTGPTRPTGPELPADNDAASTYERTRYTPDPRRAAVWAAIAKYLQRWIPDNATSLELAAGYCDLSNALTNTRRLASDLSATVAQHAAPGVETIVADARRMTMIDDASIDVLMASNFVEHLTHEELDPFFADCRRMLKPGGALVLIQPNYRLCASTYFDDYTHRSVHSHVSLPDHLRTVGFAIERVEARFLPFSMKSRLAFGYRLVGPYLRLPYRPHAGQMLIVARRSDPPATRA
jgi:SAM-dependent methyltransferase